MSHSSQLLMSRRFAFFLSLSSLLSCYHSYWYYVPRTASPPTVGTYIVPFTFGDPASSNVVASTPYAVTISGTGFEVRIGATSDGNVLLTAQAGGHHQYYFTSGAQSSKVTSYLEIYTTSNATNIVTGNTPVTWAAFQGNWRKYMRGSA